jgi:hypothetical protein
LYDSDFATPNQPIATSSPRGGSGPEPDAKSSIRPDASGTNSSTHESKANQEIRRARRIETWGIESHQSGDVATMTGRAARIQSGAATTNQPTSQRKSLAQAEVKSDDQSTNLKVLFVLTPQDTPTSGAKTDNPPK